MSLQGVTSQQEIKRTRILRDTRRLSEQVFDFLSSFEAVCVIGFLMCAVVVIMPATFDIMVILALAYGPIALRKKVAVPFRKRMGLKEMDVNDIHPGTRKPQKARGIGFIGNRAEDGMEIWAANEDLRTHIFVLGSTGAGKTEGLTSIAFNAITWVSGFTYVDGKGDVALFGKVSRMLRQYGREDDFFCINYMTGNADTKLKRSDKLSNTYNPFTVGNAESLIQLLVSLMDSSDGKGDMWKGRAISFISSLLPSLVELRDQQRLMLHIGAIREFMPYPSYSQLMRSPFISEKSRLLMKMFMLDVPGFSQDKFDKDQAQSSTFNEQYGYQQMQFTRILSSLADTYGHIYFTPAGEVNFKDIVTNRRILLVLLPALEKSRPELANLGKIIVSAMKGMMGAQLGSKLEGSQRELLDSRSTNAPTPYVAIFDEFGYFMPEDAALMWAQARSLGFCLVAAGQDVQAFYRTSKEETLAIWSNSNTKIIGKMEDTSDSYDLIEKRAGEAWVSELDTYEMDTDSLAGGYRAGTGARHVRVKRIDLQDMVNQIEGECHIFVKSDIIRARFFYAVPEKMAEYRLNHFIKVEPHSEATIQNLLVDIAQLRESLEQYPLARGADDTLVPDEVWDGAIEAAQRSLSNAPVKAMQQSGQGVERGIALFLAACHGLDVVRNTQETGSSEGSGAGGYTHTPEPSPRPEASASADSESDVVFDGAQLDSVTAFGPVAADSNADDWIAQGEQMALAASAMIYSAAGSAPAPGVPELGFLSAPDVASAVQGMAAAMGAGDGEAASIARSIIESAAQGTRYPVPPKPLRNANAVAQVSAAMDELQSLAEDELEPGRGGNT